MLLKHLLLEYDLLNFDKTYFQQKINNANSFDNEAAFFYLDSYIANGIASSKIYDKPDYFNFEIVPFLMEMFLAPPTMVNMFYAYHSRMVLGKVRFFQWVTFHS